MCYILSGRFRPTKKAISPSSGAIVFHIPERHAGLLPDDANARVRAITRMFAALNTVTLKVAHPAIPQILSTMGILCCFLLASQSVHRFYTASAGCRRIDRAAGVILARPRGALHLILRDVEQRPRVLGDNEQQRARGTRRCTPSLFPVL
jgi:hypothetical protein